jgi:hypothetical protein
MCALLQQVEFDAVNFNVNVLSTGHIKKKILQFTDMTRHFFTILHASNMRFHVVGVTAGNLNK